MQNGDAHHCALRPGMYTEFEHIPHVICRLQKYLTHCSKHKNCFDCPEERCLLDSIKEEDE